jgi:ubiquinone/menaquinone biosynthesis C-methylase UbiE
LSTDLSYREKHDRLANRIRAHKLFANFDIEDWIDRFLQQHPRTHILDLGCGDGNHLGLYLRRITPGGSVAGVDRDPGLIERARQRYAGSQDLDLRVGSMDEALPFGDGSFDTCFSNFAIYNARDVAFTLSQLCRVMTDGAQLVMIGPTANNARELYEYNQRLTGVAIDEITLVRTDRLRREILPVAREIFGDVSVEVVNSELRFPNSDEFLRYFRSTMLFEEGAERMGLTDEQMRAACPSKTDITVSKEMLAVIASKG